MSSSNSLTLSFRMQNFLDSEINLNIMTYLSQGLSFREIGEKIGKKHSFVQTRSDFLKKHKIMTFGRWNVDSYALGMVRTAEFYDYKPEIKNEILSDKSENHNKRNFYLSYFSHVIMGKMRYFAIYAYPEEVKNRTGFEITSWYYFFPHFTLPFFRNDNFEKELENTFESENNKNPLPPRGEKIKPDLIDIYLCRYIQMELEDVNLREYTRRMEEEIGNLVDVHYSTLRTRFQKLKEKGVIYPVNPLDFEELPFIRFYFITAYPEVFRFCKVLSRLNIITAISFMENNEYMVLVQCPYNTREAVAQFLGNLDQECQIFSTSCIESNRGLPYKYYLQKYASNAF